MKRALKSKLKELGYKEIRTWYTYWRKQDINLYIEDNEVSQHWIDVILEINNEQDFQELKDSISYYEEQLKTMQKDLEVLKEYEWWTKRS